MKRTWKPFKESERKEILDLYSKGHSIASIGKMVGRADSSVHDVLHRKTKPIPDKQPDLPFKEEEDVKPVVEEFDTYNIYTRIKMLQDQIDILFECIKELKNAED